MMPNLTTKEIKRITNGYLKAAKLIATGEDEFSCLAIREVFNLESAYKPYPEIANYLKVFSLSRSTSHLQRMHILLVRLENISPILSRQLLRFDLLNLMAWCWRDFR